LGHVQFITVPRGEYSRPTFNATTGREQTRNDEANRFVDAHRSRMNQDTLGFMSGSFKGGCDNHE
jgi:hypothetical protein